MKRLQNIVIRGAEFISAELCDGELEIFYKKQVDGYPNYYGYWSDIYCAENDKIVFSYKGEKLEVKRGTVITENNTTDYCASKDTDVIIHAIKGDHER